MWGGGQLQMGEGPEHIGQLSGPELGGVGRDELQQQREAWVVGEGLQPGGGVVRDPVQGGGCVDAVEVPALDKVS